MDKKQSDELIKMIQELTLAIRSPPRAVTKHNCIIDIDSFNRQTGESECDFTHRVNFGGDLRCDMISLMYVSIPKSYWLVQHDYDTMVLVENGVNTTVTIPAGNYNIRSWQASIPAVLTAASPNHWTYTISYPSVAVAADTGLFTYTVSGNGTSQPSFVFTTHVYEQFGFLRNSTNVFVGNTLTASAVMNFQLEHNLFIHSDIVRAKNSVLESIISNDSASYGQVNYVNSNYLSNAKKISTTGSNSFRFALRDSFGTPMHLNGLNWVAKLLAWES